MHRRELERTAVECLLCLEQKGVTIEIVTDFSRVPATLSQLDTSIGPALNPQRLLMTAGSSFWVFVYREELVIAAFGVRMDDLGGEDAHTFLSRSIQVIFDVRVTGQNSDIFCGRSWGRAAYFGGFVSKTAKGLSREGRQIIQMATAYVHHCAFRDLNSDINYCFLRGVDGAKGLHYGFLDADPFVWSTDHTMYSDGNPEWVMQLPRDRMPSLMTAMAIQLRKGFAENQQPFRSIKVPNPTG